MTLRGSNPRFSSWKPDVLTIWTKSKGAVHVGDSSTRSLAELLPPREPLRCPPADDAAPCAHGTTPPHRPRNLHGPGGGPRGRTPGAAAPRLPGHPPRLRGDAEAAGGGGCPVGGAVPPGLRSLAPGGPLRRGDHRRGHRGDGPEPQPLAAHHPGGPRLGRRLLLRGGGALPLALRRHGNHLGPPPPRLPVVPGPRSGAARPELVHVLLPAPRARGGHDAPRGLRLHRPPLEDLVPRHHAAARLPAPAQALPGPEPPRAPGLLPRHAASCRARAPSDPGPLGAEDPGTHPPPDRRR